MTTNMNLIAKHTNTRRHDPMFHWVDLVDDIDMTAVSQHKPAPTSSCEAKSGESARLGWSNTITLPRVNAIWCMKVNSVVLHRNTYLWIHVCMYVVMYLPAAVSSLPSMSESRRDNQGCMKIHQYIVTCFKLSHSISRRRAVSLGPRAGN